MRSLGKIEAMNNAALLAYMKKSTEESGVTLKVINKAAIRHVATLLG